MPLVISDETLSSMKLDEREARIEIACRLFGAGKMTIAQARRFADLGRIVFEEELKKRSIPAYRIDDEYWQQEKKALEIWEKRS